MIRENLIFRTALVISAAIHIGGIGLLQSSAHFFKNGISNVKDNVVIFEIGWVENSLAQKKQYEPDSKEEKGDELKTISELKSPPFFSSQKGSSGYARENIGGFADDYLLEVRRRIEKGKFYPVEAKRRLISGNVIVSFNIDNNGISKNINIVKSSGFSILDETAKEMILKANPLPRPPCGASQYIQITIFFEL